MRGGTAKDPMGRMETGVVHGDAIEDGTVGGSEGSRRTGNQKAMKQYVSRHPVCELCGSSKTLECHHIIPLCMEEYGVDFDVEDNYIAVCGKCHALLTPRRLLTRFGIERCKYGDDIKSKIPLEFYTQIGEFLDKENCSPSAADIMDIFDYVISRPWRKAI